MNTNNPKQAEMVRRAINAETTSELENLYDDWAATYDNYVGDLSYVAPSLGAALLETAVKNKQSLILDVGCGTGLVGQQLATKGYVNLHGIDLSKGMLEMAQQTGHYKKLAQADITQPIANPTNSYDAAICIGTLAIHVGTEAFDELVRLTKPSGFIVISVRDPYYEPSGYKAHIHQLVQDGVLKLLVEEEKPYILDEGAKAMYVLVQVCK